MIESLFFEGVQYIAQASGSTSYANSCCVRVTALHRHMACVLKCMCVNVWIGVSMVQPVLVVGMVESCWVCIASAVVMTFAPSLQVGTAAGAFHVRLTFPGSAVRCPGSTGRPQRVRGSKSKSFGSFQQLLRLRTAFCVVAHLGRSHSPDFSASGC